jgi:hypothetical protein
MTISGGSGEQLGGGIYNAGILTLADSSVSGNAASNFGGGIYNYDNSTLTVMNTTVGQNTANSGAGIYISNALATLTDSSLMGNIALSAGGGIYNYDPDGLFPLAISDTSITENTAASGAGIYNYNRGIVTLMGTTVESNTASTEGGGIYNATNGTVTLINSQVFSNTATANVGGGIVNDGSVVLRSSIVAVNTAGTSGGGIYNVSSGSTLTLTDSSLNSNSAGTGGAIYNNVGTVSISTSTLWNNTALTLGGGLFNHLGGLVTLSRSTVTANTATVDGGGIWNSTPFNPDPDVHDPNSVLMITNSTVSGNTSSASGGGIYSGFGGELTVSNSTIAFNVAATGGGIHNLDGVTATVRSTIVAMNTGGNITGNLTESLNNLVSGDPLLAPLASNGGPTETHALLAGSPALGAGSNPLSLTTDQRGGLFSRPLAGTIDIGAFQFHAPFNLVVDTLSDIDDGNYAPGQLSLREAITVGPNPGIDTIAFADSLNFGTITLGGTELMVVGDLEINGPGINRLTIDGHQVSRVFEFAQSSSVLVYGLTITGGNGIGSPPWGGAISSRGTLTLSSARVSGNSAQSGGGIFQDGGVLTLVNSTVTGNAAVSSGGGIFQSGGVMTVTGSTISNNTAGEVGGGIYSTGSVILTMTTLSENTSSGGGAGAFNLSGTLTMTDTLVAENVAMLGFDGGLSNTGTLILLNSTLSGNSTSNDYYGGAIFNSGEATVTNSTISGNSAQNGGGIYNDAGSLTINNSTIAFNTASSGVGDGLYNFTDATATLRSTIVAATNGSAVFGTLDPASNHNLIGGNALLGPLAFNGGPTQTHSLLAGSPAIDAGSNPTNLTSDQRGRGRMGGGAFDIGAYETRVYDTSSTGLPYGAADNTDAHRVASVNSDGHIIVFLQGWTAVDLQEQTGASNATNEAVIWVDPKDNLTYVAAPTDAGVLLFARSSTGVWSFRNLTTETNASASPTHGFVQFTSVGGVVVVAGITATDEIIAFQQTLANTPGGGPAFKSVDISADLTSQGMTSPVLSSLISYVPTWDAWHLAGIDASGRIQSVWINLTVTGFSKWRSDDLTAITGAPAIQGQLAVTLTPWGGINLTGLDTGGNLLTTWWVPQFVGNWLVDNLTSVVNGANFVAGKVIGYGTSWGGLNYIGLTTDGTVTAYWWAPGVTSWSVTPLLPAGVPSSNRPTGNLTSYPSNAGTLNVFGTSSSDDVIRMWWNPGGLDTWTAENLTNTAILG